MIIVTMCFLLIILVVLVCYAFIIRKDAYNLETFSDARIFNENDNNKNTEETLEAVAPKCEATGLIH